jgi:hypothetical protein
MFVANVILCIAVFPQFQETVLSPLFVCMYTECPPLSEAPTWILFAHRSLGIGFFQIVKIVLMAVVGIGALRLTLEERRKEE